MIDNSYYIILNRLKAFANGHYLINTFTYHEIANFDITKNPHYPIMHVVPVSMNPTKGAIDYSFNITFADWVRAKEEKQENEVTVISDLHRCALDLCAEITNGNILFGDEVSINGDAVIEPFIDEFANVLSGVTLQITIRVPYDWSACDIPANWVEGTGDIPDFGGRSLTMDIYDEGDFIVSAREMDFVGEGVTVTYTGNRAIVTITGGGGGGGVLTAIPFSTDHLTVNGNAYAIGDVVYYLGNVYRCIAANDSILPTNATYWTSLGAGYPLVERPIDWDATSGNNQILNKPSIPTATSELTNDGEDGTNPFITLAEVPAQVNSDWDAVSGVAEILNKPDLSGFGDMFKSVYDTDNDGIVDKAETVQIIVRNSTGSTLTKGQVVYLSGATGNRPNAVLAQANTEATSSKTIGIVTANIANNSDGNIAVNGTLHDLNTSSFADGDTVWLSATTAGAFTVTPPAEPNHTVFIGYIARAHPTLGRIVIAIQNGYELDELHGVSIVSPLNGQVLYYVASELVWKNKTLVKGDVGLGDVDNTSDLDKPISTATQAAIDAIPSPIYLELVRTGSVVPVSATRYAAEGLAGLATSIVITIAPRKLFTTFRVFITTAQPASGSLTVMRKFYNIAGTEIGSQSLVIAASSVAGIYEYTGATFDMSATNGSYGFTIVNAATSSSGNLNSIETVYQ
jgi:hypothetical protein